jgi:hypothetical protein
MPIRGSGVSNTIVRAQPALLQALGHCRERYVLEDPVQLYDPDIDATSLSHALLLSQEVRTGT